MANLSPRLLHWPILCAALMLCRSDRTLRADDAPYSLDEIKQRMTDWQSRIVTLRVKWRSDGDPQSKSARQENLVGVERTDHADFIWTDSGRVRYHDWLTYDGKVVTRTAYVFGTSANWIANFPRGESVETKPLRAELNNNKNHERLWGMILSPICGLWFPRKPRWLGERFEADTIALAGTETVDGRECPVVVDTCPIQGDETRMVLDPDHGFLPIRLGMPGKRVSFYQTVEEFSEPQPGFFFPKSGSFKTQIAEETYDAPRWTVESVELNEPIPDSLWQAPVADGIEVFDHATGQLYVHGGRPINPAVVDTVTDLAKALPEGAAVAATAPDQRRNWWPVGLTAAAVALLGLALILRRAEK